MRRPWIALALGLLGGVLAFGVAYWATTREPWAALRGPDAELAWLRAEYPMSEDQFQRVSALHRAYLPTCGELCRRISEQNARLQEAVLAATELTPEIARLLDETGRVRDDCRRAMLGHLFAVAREMPPEVGRRYLERMLEATCVVEQAHSLGEAHDGSGEPGHLH